MTDSNTVMWYVNNPDSPEARAAIAKSHGEVRDRIEALEDKEKERTTQIKMLLTLFGLVFGILQPILIWYITK